MDLLEIWDGVRSLFHVEPSLRVIFVFFISFLAAAMVFKRSENWEMAGNVLLIPTAILFFGILAYLVPLNMPCTPLDCINAKIEYRALKIQECSRQPLGQAFKKCMSDKPQDTETASNTEGVQKLGHPELPYPTVNHIDLLDHKFDLNRTLEDLMSERLRFSSPHHTPFTPDTELPPDALLKAALRSVAGSAGTQTGENDRSGQRP